jgi:WD40 repeat protein
VGYANKSTDTRPERAYRDRSRRSLSRIGSTSHYSIHGFDYSVTFPPHELPLNSTLKSSDRLWDLAAGKTLTQLTHHKKSVRALAIHPTEFSFASGSAGGNNIKKWKCPEGIFVHNFSGHDAIINTLSVNADGVLFSGGRLFTCIFLLALLIIISILGS